MASTSMSIKWNRVQNHLMASAVIDGNLCIHNRKLTARRKANKNNNRSQITGIYLLLMTNKLCTHRSARFSSAWIIVTTHNSMCTWCNVPSNKHCTKEREKEHEYRTQSIFEMAQKNENDWVKNHILFYVFFCDFSSSFSSESVYHSQPTTQLSMSISKPTTIPTPSMQPASQSYFAYECCS